MSAHLVNTLDSVRRLVDDIARLTRKPLIFIDLEGVNLSRHGSISIVQVLVPPNPVVHLIDVHTLKADAFDTSGAEGDTLRSILQSEEHPKVLFDVRNDSDAMFSHFQIHLHCVIDLQLIEFASRPDRGRFVKGLAKCIAEAAHFSGTERWEWQRVKDAGLAKFAPEKGGRYEVFNERPLSQDLQNYCAQDVLVMPRLLVSYAARLQTHMGPQIHAETLARIALSHDPSFNGKGSHMAVGPNFNWKRCVHFNEASVVELTNV